MGVGGGGGWSSEHEKYRGRVHEDFSSCFTYLTTPNTKMEYCSDLKDVI